MGQITTAAVERFIKAGVPTGKSHASLRDSSGLVLRLRPNGTASWTFVYRMPGVGRLGRPQTITLEHWPTLGVAGARRQAAMLRSKVMSGVDPVAEKKESMRREQTRLPAALDDYEKWMRARKLVQVDMVMASLRRGFAPLMRRTLDEIDRPAIVAAIGKIEREGYRGAAEYFRKSSVSFFSWQIRLGVIQVSPLMGYRRPKASRNEIAEAEITGRALLPAEILAVWNAAGKLGTFGGLIRFIMTTGVRRGEAANLQWRWVDRQSRLITIPAKVMKTGSEHVVIISNLVAEILDDTPDRGGGLVFPGRTLGADRPISGWSKLLKRLRAASGVADVGPHNLRRSFRSVLSELDVPEHIAELAIAHRQPHLVRRYSRSALLDQRREAAERYDGWLHRLLGLGEAAGNIVRLPRRDP